MLTSVQPKLPMRSKSVSVAYYIDKLGFKNLGSQQYEEYLMIKKDNIEIHFFLFTELVAAENYGQIYIRTDDIERLYNSMIDKKLDIHPNAPLQIKPWGQKEFSMLDPDNNLLTFGQAM